MSEQRFQLRIDGAEASLTAGDTCQRLQRLFEAADANSRSALHAWVKLGAVLLQLRPQFPRGQWEPFLKQAGVSHRAKANRAANLAKEYASGQGELDQGKVDELFTRWNSEHPEAKPLDPAAPSVRSAMTAAGMAPPPHSPAPTPIGAGQTGNVARAQHLSDHEMFEADAAAMGLLIDVGGGEQTDNSFHACAASGPAGALVGAPSMTDAASAPAGEQMAPAFLPPRRDFDGQMKFDVLYELAERNVHRLMEMVRSRTLPSEMAAAFNGWCAHAGIAEPEGVAA